MKKTDWSARPSSRNANSTWVSGGDQLTLTPTAVHAQVAAGGALNVTTGFTVPGANGNVGYTILVTLGAGGTNPTVYTVTGTFGGSVVSEEITAEGAGEVEGTQPFTSITSITTPDDPGGTSDFDTLDAHMFNASRGVWVGGTGILSCQLAEDSADTVFSGVPTGTNMPVEVAMVRCNKASRTGIQETTATLITVAR